MKMLTAATVTIVAFAVLVAPSSARRPARASERAAIARATHTPARCSRVYVSTVDRRFASYEYRDSASCRRYASNGVDVLRRTSGHWRSLGGMSDCQPGSAVRGVPRAVYRDLTRAYCAGSASVPAQQHTCGHIGVKGGPGEADAVGVKCATALSVLRAWLPRQHSPTGWRCRKGSQAVYVTCKRNSDTAQRAVLYQPASVFGE